MKYVTTDIQGETLLLDPDRALFWQKKETIIVSDLHLGKGLSMRQSGLAIPSGSTKADLARLRRLVQQYEAKRLIVVGDFYHAKASLHESTKKQILSFRQELCDLEILLIRGNHDKRAGDPPIDFNIECFDEPYLEPPFAFCHFPQSIDDFYTISGHMHPCIKLRDRDGSKIRFPCFQLGPKCAVLPSFGSFTGMKEIEILPEHAVYIITGEEIYTL